jgi:hypothetical protein
MTRIREGDHACGMPSGIGTEVGIRKLSNIKHQLYQFDSMFRWRMYSYIIKLLPMIVILHL